MSFEGFVNAGLQLGLQSIVVSPNRRITNIMLPDQTAMADIVAQATVEEMHTDELEITEHPVEQGAPIVDHAYKRPSHVVVKMAWSNSPTANSSIVNQALGIAAANNSTVNGILNVTNAISGGAAILSTLNGANVDQVNAAYASLLWLQQYRALFTLVTGKRTYYNMICRSLSTETSWKTANSAVITMTCQEVILVQSQTVALPASTQALPSITASPINQGTQQLNQLGSGTYQFLL